MFGDHPYASIEGSGYMFWNRQGMTLLTFGDATVMGSDQNTTLVALGRGDVTFMAGDGNNIAYGGYGNDTLIGGEGFNRFFGGAGDDLLIGGNGINDLNGGYGNDTITFGQNDQVSGGPGADHFIFVAKPNMGGGTSDPHVIYPEFLTLRDFSIGEGDVLDLSMNPEIHQSQMTIYDDALFVFEPGKVIVFENVGHQITLYGGIDAVIKAGELMVAYDPYYGAPPLPTVSAEVTLVGITATTGDHVVSAKG